MVKAVEEPYVIYHLLIASSAFCFNGTRPFAEEIVPLPHFRPRLR